MNDARRRPSSNIRSLALTLIILTAIISISFPSTTTASLADLPYRLVPVMTSSMGANLASLASDGVHIVWEDQRGGTSDVYVYDVNEQREFRASRTEGVRQQPAINASEIIWVAGDGSDRTIEGIDLSEATEFSVTDEPGNVARPAISDALIVWQERVDDRWVIQAIDRVTGDEITLGVEGRNAGRPAVSDSTVVWQQHDGETWNIHSWNADSNTETQLTSSADDDQTARVSNNWIVFIRNRAEGGPPTLVAFNRNTRSEQILSDEHYVANPSVHGDIVVWEDWRSGLPDIYAYDLSHDEVFAVARSQQATSPVVTDTLIAWVSGNNSANQRIQALEMQDRLPTDPQDPPAVPSPERLYVPQTQHFVSSGFKAFWQANGGPAVLGYPLTEEFTEVAPDTGEEIIVQYFERVKLEYHPNAPEDERVRLARLGDNLHPPRERIRIDPFENSDERRYFDATGQGISYGFKEYWESNGGLMLFGYPLTGEFVENGRTVQYFERARFEYDPEADGDLQVTLGLLGREALQQRGWLPPPPVDTTQVFE